MASRENRIRVGIIGCGNISQVYFDSVKAFDVLECVACADLNMDVARAKAQENGCEAQTVEELLANEDVDLVINLTIPAVHAEVSMAALRAGKHVHTEKPLAVHLEDGRAVLDLAEQKGLLVGCAPDTFMGASLQTCRKGVDDGRVGRVIGGTAFMMCRGPESWHPNPAFFYLEGAGPMFDMGPYYITTLVHLLGPVKRVSAITTRAFEERTATCEERSGEKLAVEVPTHYCGTLEFHSGAVITMSLSFDVHSHGHSPIEIYGTEGSMRVPDPNMFDGAVEIRTPDSDAWETQPASHGYGENMRGIGAADLAYAILGDRPHRASGELGYHVLEVMHAFEESSDTGRHVTIESKPAQPAPLPQGLVHGRLDP